MTVLLQINEIHKAYGAMTLLDDATASFADDQKIGVIGRNGAGKSTLCRIITGHEPADSGTVTRNAALRLSYLEQHDTFKPGENVLDFLMRTTRREHWECGQMAARFQLPNEMLEAAVRSLPGGFQTRVKLSAMLLRDPNFLVLDEPSNYLDLSTLILLENFLLGFNGGYLIVSHDREFLKRTCDHTLEVENGGLALYPGDIEEYFEFKEVQVAQKQAFNRGVEKKREQLQAFVDRFRAKASTATRAQSKMKQLARLKTIEIAHPMSNVRIRIPAVESKGGVALSCEGLTIGYPDKDVARRIHVEIERGNHVAVLGNNGEGKTTFLRTIAGDLAPKEGSFRWGTGLKVAYYAQHVFATLDPEDDIYTHLMREAAEGVKNQDILDMAGCFLFRGDDVKKKVKVLSGGERARLVLAGLLLSKSHVLLLDEPTNHLDFETVEALGNALKEFQGTVIFISHDRTFVNLVASSILEVKKGRILHYRGSYEDYVYHLEQVARGEEEDFADDASSEPETVEPVAVVKPEPSKVGEKKAEIKKLQKAMEKAEGRVKHYTAERDKLVDEMTRNPLHFSKERNVRLKEAQIQIEKAEEEWCSLQTKLEKLQK
ncbi:MAG TPA: ABC-F family ATP-binding cassette domain-containing protein [Candidatus Omnitrophota bacterium]|nr:ABC-F family ATP-binding cassette domain-containing protein [Candidatus Omnitrophota bacterium]HPS37241.1 ABC-F family ATP-binding cassette domain-containing protein [Candidatus Omnitrophota bacterium]